MRRIILILFVFFIHEQHCLAQLKDVEGWSKARWGMTEEEILKAFTGEAKQLEKRENYKNAYATVGIDDIEIGGAKYKVRFLMDNYKNTLRQVLIKTKDENPAGAEVWFKSLEQMLVEKYGQPSYKDEKREPDRRISRTVVLEGSVKLTTAWNFPTTIIELSYLEIRSINSRILTISYRQRLKERLDNL